MGLGIKLHYGLGSATHEVNDDMDFLNVVKRFHQTKGGVIRKYRKSGRQVSTIDGLFDSYSKKSVNAINKAAREAAAAKAKETGEKQSYTRLDQSDAILAMSGQGNNDCAPLERDAEAFINNLARRMGYENYIPYKAKRATIEWLLTELVSAEENEGSEFLKFTDIAVELDEEASEASETPVLDSILETSPIAASFGS